MLMVKLLAPILILILAILKDYLPEKLKSKKWVRPTSLTLLIVATIASAVIIFTDSISNDEIRSQNSKLNSSIDSLMKVSSNSSVALDKQGTSLAEVNRKLDPFIIIAQTKYPKLEISEALRKLQTDIAEVRESAKPNGISLSKYSTQKIGTN
jgi:cytoskeletal protein RodZ